jgi:hypothetical protein
VDKLEADPGVMAIFAPSQNIVNTPLNPQNHGLEIQIEANSIVNHYAPLTGADFEANPSPGIPGPIAAPRMPMNVCQAKIALHAIHINVFKIPLIQSIQF